MEQKCKKDLGLTREHFSYIYNSDTSVIKSMCTKHEYLSRISEANNLFKSLGITADDYISYWLKHDIGVDQKVIDFIKKINRVFSCYIGSNQEKLRTNHILDLVGEHFLDCFTSCAIGAMKPEQEFFHHIQKTLSLLPHELLLIDDSKNNIDGAQKCGWHVYHYQNDIEGVIEFLKKVSGSERIKL